MPKMRISRDEWWPVFGLENEDGYGDEIEISDVLLEQYRSASAAFNKMQGKLSELYTQVNDYEL